MKRKQVRLTSDFKVVLGNERSQAAEMVLPPGEAEGGPDNRHRGADQWLFVVSGRGQATINRRRYPLAEHTLLLIEEGDLHEIKNTSRSENWIFRGSDADAIRPTVVRALILAAGTSKLG